MTTFLTFTSIKLLINNHTKVTRSPIRTSDSFCVAADVFYAFECKFHSFSTNVQNALKNERNYNELQLARITTTPNWILNLFEFRIIWLSINGEASFYKEIFV